MNKLIGPNSGIPGDGAAGVLLRKNNALNSSSMIELRKNETTVMGNASPGAGKGGLDHL